MRLQELSPEAIVERGRLAFGTPRSVRVGARGDRVAFLRSPGPRTAEQELWLLTRERDGRWSEHRLDASAAGTDAPESRAAQAMRERTRELAAGIIDFTADDGLDEIVFAAGGHLWRASAAQPRRLDGTEGAEEPRLSPDGRRLAFVHDGTVRVVALDAPAKPLARLAPDGEHETVGRPDFIAAEEMGRFEGMWWAPDSGTLAVQRTDDGALPAWTIANPGDPSAAPTTVRYPAAGGPNARVGLTLVDIATGERRDVRWDGEAFPYLCRVAWTAAGGLTLDVQTRDQRTVRTLAVDVATGSCVQRAEITDEHWVEPGNGTRTHAPDGALCQLLDRDGVRVLRMGEREAPLPADAPLLDVAGRCAAGLLVELATSRIDRRIALVRWDGAAREWLSDATGVARAWGGGDTVVVQQRSLDHDRPETRIVALDESGALVAPDALVVRGATHPIASHAEPLEWTESVELFDDLRDGGSAAALLLPIGYDADRDGPLPVILDPYGGPQFALVVRDRRAYAHARWLAEQGYAVLAIDGIGTPGRGPRWERGIAGDFTRTLDSQVDGLEEISARRPGVLDLAAVGIRGWSFGGYLAALAAIRRPDLIRAAAVGAPVSDWRLYDTHYTERYLGYGAGFAEIAARNSLAGAITAAIGAGQPPSPMLIIHGFEDDNVVVAHAIRLAEALTAHAVPHASLLLPSLTHVGRTSTVAQLQRLELEFLDRHLRRRPQ
jgi:dipeptidyl-peptidase-4